jgi:hypothetical protein
MPMTVTWPFVDVPDNQPFALVLSAYCQFGATTRGPRTSGAVWCFAQPRTNPAPRKGKRKDSGQQGGAFFDPLWPVDPAVGEAGAEPHADQRQPGRQREDGSAGDAGADGAAAGEHAAEAHA